MFKKGVQFTGIEKLLHAILCAFGAPFKSYFDCKNIDTEVYRIKELAKANKEAEKIYFNKNKILDLPEGRDLEERVKVRVDFQEQRQHLNIENIIYQASEILKDEDSVDSEPVDEDWINQFFETCKNVSNETMQKIWAKILAGEIKKPRSFSLRTLQLLRSMSQKDAECFLKLSKFTILDEDTFAFVVDPAMKLNKNYEHNVSDPISYSEYLSLLELGLISSNTSSPTVNDKTDQSHARLENGDIQKVFIFGGILKATLTIKADAHELIILG